VTACQHVRCPLHSRSTHRPEQAILHLPSSSRLCILLVYPANNSFFPASVTDGYSDETKPVHIIIYITASQKHISAPTHGSSYTRNPQKINTGCSRQYSLRAFMNRDVKALKPKFWPRTRSRPRNLWPRPHSASGPFGLGLKLLASAAKFNSIYFMEPVVV